MFKSENLKRENCGGKTEVTTFRLPLKLKQKIQKFAIENGRTTTDVVTTVLDQFIQTVETKEKLVRK